MKALALLMVLAAPAAGQETAVRHAAGTFEVTITPEAQAAARADALPTSRMGLVKTFTGGVVGTAIGTMLTAGMPQPGKVAVYVAIDQVSGSVDGRRGGFVLLHQGTMSTGGSKLDVVIAPDSGTGELRGIAGTLSIDVVAGVHHYDLAYTLPPKG